MFTRLLESGSRKSRQERWLSASTGLHLLVIASAVTLTPERERVPVDPPEQVNMVFVRDPGPSHPAFRASPTSSTGQSTGRFRFPTARDLTDIVGIVAPDIDLRQDNGASASDFRHVADGCHDTAVCMSMPSLSGSPMSAGQVDKPALPLPGNVSPAYPEMLRNAGVEGSVTLRFVIDTTGAVEAGSVSVVRSDHELFTSAVRAALAKHHFLAAEAAGRKVRMLVEQRFDFVIQR